MVKTGRFFEIHRRKSLRILKWLFSYAEAYCVVAYVMSDIILKLYNYKHKISTGLFHLSCDRNSARGSWIETPEAQLFSVNEI